MAGLNNHRASMWDDFGSDPEARVELYDRAAALADSGKLSGEDAAAVQKDFERRVQAFGQLRTRRGDASGFAGGGFTAVGVFLFMLVLLVIALWVLMHWWKTVLIVGAIAMAISAAWRFARGRLRVRVRGGGVEVLNAREFLQHCLETRRCPGCEYDLSGLGADLPGIGAGVLGIGPRACPECGVKWPLVPPEAAR